MNISGPAGPAREQADAQPTLTVRDDRTGETYVLPIEQGAIRAAAWPRQLYMGRGERHVEG